MESYTHYAKEKKKNVMIAVFMRILKNTILHIQRNKKASLQGGVKFSTGGADVQKQ